MIRAERPQIDPFELFRVQVFVQQRLVGIKCFPSAVDHPFGLAAQLDKLLPVFPGLPGRLGGQYRHQSKSLVAGR